jgi:hypothetical protein
MVVPVTFGGVIDAAGAEDRTGTATAAATAAAAPVAAKTLQVLDSPIIGNCLSLGSPDAHGTPTAPKTQAIRRLRGRLPLRLAALGAHAEA